MDTFDTTIIGAGVVGLAIAEEISTAFRHVLLVEKNATYGQETSSRNSEVIHAGIHYPAGFLKSTLCVQGNRLLYEICKKRNIQHKRLGKLIVATSDNECDALGKIKEQAEENGVDDLTFLGKRQIQTLEPEVRAKAALFSPSTGIIDTHGLMRSLYLGAENNGTIVAFRSEVTAVHFDGNVYNIEINEGEYRFQTKVLINSAGLYADRIAALAGIDNDRKGYRLRYCKGNYFSLSPSPKLHHLIYPIPAGNNENLGIHATVDLGGRVRFGPDSQYVNALEYSVDESRKTLFYQSMRKYLPGIRMKSLSPEMSGIRPKLQGPCDPCRDFIITDEREAGFPGLINLIGIESPGLTSCIPIARHVSSLVRSYF
ncbi:MAG: NAD(P)/FAD-dependent oxidoreductase [Syntrophales bacterium]|nr:NAD(P)/FAD-dependent oxidoreductase [Syntrophales bacterium]